MIYMNKKHKGVKAEINLDVERTRYSIYKQELLAEDFSKLQKWMNGKSIDAFTSASVPKSTAEKVQDIASDGLKNVALSVVGVKLRRVETDCFWVLSNTDLHLFTTNTVGELDEHIIFDHFQVEAATLQYGGVLKSQLGVYSKSSQEYLPETHIITLNVDGSPISLEIHDRLKYVPNPTDLLDVKKQFLTRAKYQVVGEQFLPLLQKKFPNLKA